jgi:cellulose synthase/poly-beta-1,6-N-acetylglucosamine synthase-like glycosyltransferase
LHVVRTELVHDWLAVALLLIDLALALVVALFPLWRDYGDDQGDGRALVLLNPPRRVSAWRAAAFMVITVGAELIHEGVTSGALDGLYSRPVTALAGIAVRAPTEVGRLTAQFHVNVRLLVVVTIVALAATVDASIGRRLFILLQVVWYIALMICIDAVVVVGSVIFNVSPEPSMLISNLLGLGAGLLILLRTVFANFALPRPSTIEVKRRHHPEDAATLLILIVVTAVFVVVGAVIVIDRAPSTLTGFLDVAIPLAFGGVTTYLLIALLNVARWLGPAEPVVGDDRPAVDVIIPAFNEEDWIVETLEAIDRAAVRYQGPVRVVLADDGSTDHTNERARDAIGGFRAATGDVIRVRHGGKSATLNSALAECRADIVVRIDADTLIDEWSIYYAVRWFRNPEIGQVEAFTIPRHGSSFFHRMRHFECLKTFGFIHRGLQVVDSVNVVPGMFTAFRRQPVVEQLGGFTVGMNGEDTDLTLSFGRLGYRTWLDTKVRIYEDVPPTYRSFREQRIRWSRSSIHTLARHALFRGGRAGTRIWFGQTRMVLGRFFGPVRLTALTYLALLAVIHPTYRQQVIGVVVVFFLVYSLSQTVTVLVALRFRIDRWLPWLLLWGPFSIVKQWFFLEALLSLPPRPVRVPGFGRVPEIAAPVIH